MKKFYEMNDEDKNILSKMCGNILLWMHEARSTGYMAEKLNLEPWQVDANVDEMLYVLKKTVGIKRFLKVIFLK